MSKTDERPITIRAFSVIEAILAAGRPLGLAEVMATGRLPKPTAYRILRLLEEAGVVAKDPDGRRFGVGPTLERMGLAVLRGSARAQERHAVLQGLAEASGETCAFAVLDGAQAVYADAVASHWPLRFAVDAGSRVPAHCTASGRALLAQLPRAERDRLVAKLRLARHTSRTVTDPALLRVKLEETAVAGYALEEEEYLVGLSSISVPVKTENGLRIGALAIFGPSNRLSADQARAQLAVLQDAATRLADTFTTLT
jgi:IclR family transcriptional regulator, acetate operon repressor